MTFKEATTKLIDDPHYPLDINLLSREDQEKLFVWAKLCSTILGQGSLVDEWIREGEQLLNKLESDHILNDLQEKDPK